MRKLVVFIVMVAGLAALAIYALFYGPSVKLNAASKLIYIRTGWNFNQVDSMMGEKHLLRISVGFRLVSEYKGYEDEVIPGRYRILSNMSNAALVNMLLAGKQEPENISLHNIIYKQDLAGIVGSKMEDDSAMFMQQLNDTAFIKTFGLNPVNVLAMFVPGTYKMLWTETPEAFIIQMHHEYEQFWTKERRRLAAEAGLTPLQVSILASIVQAEQSEHIDEKPVIAGLYINRLREGMPLQSDATLVYARGDFSIARVRNGDKEVESPYNTYKHIGLPPGPINMPEPSSIDAVLHYVKSNYLYMCAEADNSGRHHFSTTLKEQIKYEELYHNYLNMRDIER